MSHNILCPLRQQADRQPDAVAIRLPDKTISYRQLDRRVHAMVRAMSDQGVTAGQHVAILTGSPLAETEAFLALLRLGAVACPLNSKFPDELLKTTITQLECRFALDLGGRSGAIPTGCQILHIKGIQEKAYSDYAPETLIDLDRWATIVLTSGSSGRHKGVVLSYGNHYYNALGANEHIPLMPGDGWLMALPTHHVSGIAIVFRCLLAGAAVCLAEEFKFTVELFKRTQPTHISLVPVQLRRLLNDASAQKHLPKMKAVLVGGGPVPQGLIRRACQVQIPIYITYGLTEMASQVATTPVGTSGSIPTGAQILPYREAQTGPDGHILVRGKTLFCGYYSKEGFTRPVDSQGWFDTKDIGRVDEGGRLFVLGRADNMFISGGENIYPEEIERLLEDIAPVETAIVLAIPDDEYGSRPVALLAGGSRETIPSREALRRLLEKHLPRFKIPDSFHLIPEGSLPGSLKADRVSLRQQFINQKDRFVELP